MKNAEQETSRFGKYVILGELGHGGFATVYRARDASLKREVALKVLHPQLMVDPLFVTRFENDARAAGQLEHPHIVVIYDLGHLEGAEYIAMQLLAGGSLTARLRDQGRFTLAQTLRIVEQVAGALDYAHDRGFVHRDIKPSNILFNSRDEAVVADFGLVKAVETSIIARSSAGGVIGTPSYIAPEVWEGKEAGPATDIYALGCVIYELLTGQVLFAGDTSPAIMRAHFLPPRFPAAWPEGTPPDVQAILTKALAADPANRYARAGALADDLAALVQRAADPLAEPYRALQAALAAEDWASALAQAQTLAAANPGYRDVRALAQRAAEGQARAERAQWAAQWRAQTLEAIQAAQWEVARVAARRWLEMAPDDREAVQAQQTIAASLAAAQPAKSAAPAPVSPSAAADARPEQSQADDERQRGEETELGRREAEPEARAAEDEARRAAPDRAEADAAWARHGIQKDAASQRRPWLWVAGGIALLALAFAVLRPRMGDGAATPAPATEVSAGATRVRETDGAEMVYVPASEFTMGSADNDTWAYPDEKPQQRVTVAGFWIDRTEVTNAQYRKFVDAGGYDKQEYWTEAGWAWKQVYNVTQPNCWNDSGFNQEQQPVACVSWYEAYAYARWVGGRLPSEAEWEKAARGTDGRIYPWGNTWVGSRLNHCDQQCQYGWKDASVNDGYRTTAPVGSYANGTSPYGVMDLAGNVREWVGSEYRNYPYRSDDGREDQSRANARVLRGGSWSNEARDVRSAYRFWIVPGNRGDNIGFRVASPGL